MGRKSKLKAKRRKVGGRKSRRLDPEGAAEIVAALQAGERVVTRSLRLLREHGVDGPRAFRSLAWLVYALDAGLSVEEAEEPRVSPEQVDALLESTKVTLVRVMHLATADVLKVDARVRADAVWMVGTLGVTPADLGMEPRSSGEALDDLFAEIQRSVQLVDAFVGSVWEGVFGFEDQAQPAPAQLVAPNAPW